MPSRKLLHEVGHLITDQANLKLGMMPRPRSLQQPCTVLPCCLFHTTGAATILKALMHWPKADRYVCFLHQLFVLCWLSHSQRKPTAMRSGRAYLHNDVTAFQNTPQLPPDVQILLERHQGELLVLLNPAALLGLLQAFSSIDLDDLTEQETSRLALKSTV